MKKLLLIVLAALCLLPVALGGAIAEEPGVYTEGE